METRRRATDKRYYRNTTLNNVAADKRRGTLSGGTDGRVPFVLPPRCPASAMQPAGMVGNGRRDGTARAQGASARQ